MIQGKKVLGIIPARGGSKGILGKNVRMVAGKPLIAWTIEAAARSRYLDKVIMSSDDTNIIEVARRYGCEVPFVRPDALAADDTPGISPVLHALEELPGYDMVVLLQPTSPLRSVDDIDGTIAHCLAQKAPACVSVSPSGKSPYWMYTLDDQSHLQPLLNADSISCRQDLPEVMALNGAVYVAETSWLIRVKGFFTSETVGYVMPPGRSWDIDSEMDLQVCDLLLQENS